MSTVVNQTIRFPDEMNWTVPFVHAWIQHTFEVSFSERGTRDLLYHLGLSYTKPTYTLQKAVGVKQATFLEEFEHAKKTNARTN